MRALAAFAVLAALSARGSAADEPPRIVLKVGEERTGLGIMPRCDDLAVVAVTADGRGLRGVRPGTTLCSFDRSGGGGARQVWRIVIVPAAPARDPDAPPAGGRR
jgi:hypothetical protein